MFIEYYAVIGSHCHILLDISLLRLLILHHFSLFSLPCPNIQPQSCVFVSVSFFVFSKKINDIQEFRMLSEQFLYLRKHGLIDISCCLELHLKIILQRLSIKYFISHGYLQLTFGCHLNKYIHIQVQNEFLCLHFALVLYQCLIRSCVI